MEIIRTNNLSKTYGEFKAIDNINFSINEGEIFTIIGPNGAGKSTIIKILTGIIDKTDGDMLILGLKPENRIEINKRIGYMPEENALYENMTISRYLRFFSELYRMDGNTARKRITDLCNSLRIRDPDQRIAELSKGNQRKVLLIRAILHDPILLILDEPTSGLDPVTTSFLLDYLKSLKAKGKTIIFSAHNLYQVEELSDRVMILKEGRVLVCDTIKNIKSGYKGFSISYLFNKKKIDREFCSKEEMIDYLNKINTSRITDISMEQVSLQKLFVDQFND